MARGVNRVTLVGNLGADPEVRHMPGGGAVTSISIATTEAWTDKATGQKKEETEWHRVSMFNRMAEVAAEFLKKGSQVYIEGKIKTDKYQDKTTGEDRYSTQIIARDMQLLGGRGDESPAPQRTSAPAPSKSQQGAPPVSQGFDDDIPFVSLHSYP